VERIEIPIGEFVFDARALGPPDGELVLLLHGFPQTSLEWRAQMHALADAGYRCVAPDQRGYSRRARPEGVEQYDPEHLIGDVVAIADWLGGHRFHLVGHDWGGAIAWGVAARHGERLRTLTVVSTPHPAALIAARHEDDGDQRSRSSYIDVFRAPGHAAEDLMLQDDGAGLKAMITSIGGDDDLDEYVHVLQEPGALTAALNWYRAMKPGLVGDLGNVTTPTLYVWSDNDIALGRYAAEATAEYVSGPYRFEVLEGVSHWIPEHAPAALNRLLLEHLAHDWS
jgi:pimeloyl-ACP methyl ester carboxylesterase